MKIFTGGVTAAQAIKALKLTAKANKLKQMEELKDFENDYTIGKVIRLKDYPKTWPFKAPEALVRCMDKYCIAVDIKGETYALNGTMQDKFPWMSTPFDDDLIKPDPLSRKYKMSIGWVIQFGLDLWGDKQLLPSIDVVLSKDELKELRKENPGSSKTRIFAWKLFDSNRFDVYQDSIKVMDETQAYLMVKDCSSDEILKLKKGTN